MSWPPFFTLDLAEQGLLPEGWEAAAAALAEAPEREMIIDERSGEGGWSFAVVDGAVLRDRLPWLSALYHGALRDFAGECVGVPLFAATRLPAGMTLNILSGVGAMTDWHTDMTTATGVLFLTPAQADGGGDLLFRRAGEQEVRLRPRPGLFVCFPGAIEHHVVPLGTAGPRLSVALLYFDSATGQARAPDMDVYPLPA